MKFSCRLGASGLLLLLGCSGIPAGSLGEEQEATLHSVSAQLLVDGSGLPVVGQTAEVEFELDCGGTVVHSGVIPVPLDGSSISGQFGAVEPAEQCQLTLSVSLNLAFASEPTTHCFATTEFEVLPSEPVDLGPITVICAVDTTSDVASLFSDFVQLVDDSLESELFDLDEPLLVEPDPDDDTVPPVTLSLAGPLQPGVQYVWSVEPASGGTFVGCDASPEECEFHCVESGTHEVVITASFADQTLSRSFEVTCPL